MDGYSKKDIGILRQNDPEDLQADTMRFNPDQHNECKDGKTTELLGMISNTPAGKQQTKLLERLKHDEQYRSKIILWGCLCMSTFMMGWGIGQVGPSLLDLKEITQVALDEASFFLTSIFVGYLSGTCCTGAIYARINPYLLLLIGISLMSITSAAIPWCSLYGIMIVMHTLKGIGFGVLDTAGNAIFMSKFKTEKEIYSYMQTIHLMFAIGGLLSPIATAPFLMEYKRTNVKFTNDSSTVSVCNESIDVGQFSMDTFTQQNVSYKPGIPACNETVQFNQRHSNLYKPYLLSAALCSSLVLPFTFLCYKHRKLDKKSKPSDRKRHRQLPRVLKCCILLIMCLFLAVDNGMEDTVFGLFSTFIVQRLGWTKQNASYAISVYWASFACGRLCAIIIGPKFKSSRLLRYYLIVFIVGLIGLLLSVVFLFHIGVWISFPIMGFAVSVFFPTIFVWIENDSFCLSPVEFLLFYWFQPRLDLW